MDDPDDDLHKTVGAVLIGTGLGMLLGAVVSSVQHRAAFEGVARGRLNALGVYLLSSELGRDQQQQALWILTLRLPTGHVLTLHVPVAAGHDPFSPATTDSVLARVNDYLRTNHLVA